jgi:hypothetical protein
MKTRKPPKIPKLVSSIADKRLRRSYPAKNYKHPGGVNERGYPRPKYITPEDVGAALAGGADPDLVRLEVLAHLGKQTGYGCEDGGLCAFVAFCGPEDESIVEASP